MNILIVEDQKEKSKDITDHLASIYKTANIMEERSLRSGLKTLLSSEKFDLVVLDMSMPNFEPTQDDPIGGTPESFAGREFLAQMELRDIEIPVIVLSQYETFEKGQIDLSELGEELKELYPKFFLGTVYYSSANNSWHQDFDSYLYQINEKT